MGGTRGWLSCWALLAVAAQAQTGMRIRVVEGDHAINSIRMRRGHDPVVQVLDASGEPLPNATVSFLLPATGASGTFGNSGMSLTVQTDSHGMAAGRGLAPNRIEGPFQIRVTASSKGEAANASVSQTNAEPVGKSSRSKWIVIAVVAGGAGIAGAVLAAHGGGNSSTPPAGGTTGAVGGGTITPGTPSFGPPR